MMRSYGAPAAAELPPRVPDHQLEARILQGLSVVGLEESRSLDDRGLDLERVHLLDRVLQHRAHRHSASPADHADPPGVDGEKRQMPDQELRLKIPGTVRGVGLPVDLQQTEAIDLRHRDRRRRAVAVEEDLVRRHQVSELPHVEPRVGAGAAVDPEVLRRQSCTRIEREDEKDRGAGGGAGHDRELRRAGEEQERHQKDRDRRGADRELDSQAREKEHRCRERSQSRSREVGAIEPGDLSAQVRGSGKSVHRERQRRPERHGAGKHEQGGDHELRKEERARAPFERSVEVQEQKREASGDEKARERKGRREHQSSGQAVRRGRGVRTAPVLQKSGGQCRAARDPEEKRREHDRDAVDRGAVDHRERARPRDLVNHGARPRERYRCQERERNRGVFPVGFLGRERRETEPPPREEDTEANEKIERGPYPESRAQADGGKEPEHGEKRTQDRARGVGRVEAPDSHRGGLVRVRERPDQHRQRRSHGDGRG